MSPQHLLAVFTFIFLCCHIECKKDAGLSSPGQRTGNYFFQFGLQVALHRLRDSKKNEIPEERKRALNENIEEPRHNVPVSFKECNLERSQRLDCGHSGITEESCYAQECCWGETTQPDVPWCYHSTFTISSQCLMDVRERKETTRIKPSNGVPIFDGECGVPAILPKITNHSPRIVGGIDAVKHSWPWMVSLQIGNEQDHFCGGSLINNQWIVSAAHCESEFSATKEIVLGMHSQESSETTKVRVEVDKLFAHEHFRPTSGKDNDIMLIKLKTAVEFTDAISPVCLPEQDSEVTPGRHCYATGWGHTRFGGSLSDRLRQVMVPILESDVCNQEGWYYRQVEDTMICAGYEEGGRDSCQGDSGGPLVCYESGKWMLTGIASWGKECARERKPGIYTKTSMYIEWIQSTINANLRGAPAIQPITTHSPRIVGGMDVREHSWPWMVSLQVDHEHFCGGSLINNQWVLSAAHCMPGFMWGREKEIVLGMHSQTSRETTKVRVKVDTKNLFAHENYGQASGMGNDIMLIKLKTAVKFTDAISPVGLPKQDSKVSPGRRCYTTGWGYTRSGGSPSDRLQQVKVPILEPEVCNQGQWYGGQVDDTMICAGYAEGGQDSCQGDSGGPLVCYENSKWILTGIVSWGEGCASERKPGIYTKTSKYNQWIKRTINANLD